MSQSAKQESLLEQDSQNGQNQEMSQRLIDTYKQDGYVIVDNFLPEDVADQLNNLYVNENGWEFHDQVREDHYKHVFKMPEDSSFPQGDEAYLAKFSRSKQMEESEKIKDIFSTYFKPTLKQLSGVALTEYDNRCYKQDIGDFYRTHIDAYAGEIGCIYYASKNWVWDWGGILHVGTDELGSDIQSVFPKFNRAIFLDHGGFRFPHFISAVSEYAKSPRYTMVSFNK